MICSSSKIGCYNLNKLRRPRWSKRLKTANSVKPSSATIAITTLVGRRSRASARRMRAWIGAPEKPDPERPRLKDIGFSKPQLRAATIIDRIGLCNRSNCKKRGALQSAAEGTAGALPMAFRSRIIKAGYAGALIARLTAKILRLAQNERRPYNIDTPRAKPFAALRTRDGAQLNRHPARTSRHPSGCAGDETLRARSL